MERRGGRDDRGSWRDDGDYRSRQDHRDYSGGGGGGRWNDSDRSFAQGRHGDCGREQDRSYNRARDWDSAKDADGELSSSVVWIGGLPKDITQGEIEQLCSKYGPSEICIKHSKNDTFAFVHYDRVRQANAAIHGLDLAEAFGTMIKVAPSIKKGSGKGNFDANYYNGSEPGKGYRRNNGSNGNGWTNQRNHNTQRSRSREPSPPKTTAVSNRPVRVYLSQLPRDMEDDELQDLAKDFGIILQYELHREGAYKCGWVEYASKAEAEAAVAALDERGMDEWHMRLQAYSYPGGD